MKLILVRHGHVQGIDPPRFRGRKEVPLTALGRKQAELAGAEIARRWTVEAIYTSPLGRCVKTSEAIAAATGAPIATLPGLVDFDYGEWAWRTHEEVGSAWPELHALWFTQPWRVAIPGGDTLQALVARTADALHSIVAAHPVGTVVAVAHDSANRALLLQCLGLPLEGYWRIDQAPCCINEIDFAADVRVRLVNDTSHLDSISSHPNNQAPPL